ncbi:MAG: DinB family protein [Acidimicrobiales bacterium]
MLDAWLDYHRTTLLLKCEGLDAEGLRARPVATSSLNLHGLVRHMAEVERSWFRRVLEGEGHGVAGPIYYDDAINPDGDIEVPEDAVFADDLAIWNEECEQSRAIAAAHGLDDTNLRRGTTVSLRWILLHMIEEYARHNGHADLLRELIDGRVGD